MSFSGPADKFSNLLRRNQAFSPSKIYDVIRLHLNKVYSSSSGEANEVHSLYQHYYPFIVMGLNNIRTAIEEVSHSEPCELLKTYDLLLRCLKNLKPWFNWSVLSEHWRTYINSLIVRNDISTTRKEIRAYMEFLGLEKHHCIVPVYDMKLDKSLLNNTLDILMVYMYCLSQSCNTQDAKELFSVIQKLDPWMKDLDGDDMKRRSLLVEHLIETINYHDDDLAAEHMAVTLLEQNKVCKDARLLELGLAFVHNAVWDKKDCLRRVIGHLDRQCQVATHRFPNMNVWAANLMQLQSHSGRLHPTIFITIQSLILDGHTKDILCDKGDSLRKPMTLIADARVERERGVQGLDTCLANLDSAIELLHKCKVKAGDLGSLYFLQAQALCLRALSRYENCNSKKINWCKQNFTEDIDKALKLVTNTYFSELAAKYMCLSKYLNNLFCLVIDVLLTEHNENDHGLVEKIISLCEPHRDVGMLWQFKSHHSHLKSEVIDDYFAGNFNFFMDEGGCSEEPERGVIASKVTKSLKSRCRAAQFYYDQAERMLLMGKMSKALDHAREGRERRYHLLEENFELTLKAEKVHTFHMNHVVAARIWSISFEEFILAPNSCFVCYLNSISQESTILELIGDQLMAKSALEFGKSLSLQRRPSFYLGRFHAAISRIHRKTQDITEAKKELRQAEELRRCVSCKNCQLLLKLEISKESAKQKRKNGRDTRTSKYPCRCWECTCRFSLLNVLKEKGKDYVFKDETSKAHDVFLENMSLVVSLSSLPSWESPRTLSKLFDLVKRPEIKVVHGTHIAELIYIISWVACTKGTSDGNFSIPNETLLDTLKHALILSSETPELSKKVAQLLAIMYLPGYFKEPPLSTSANSLTQCHWACFFHELAVGSGVDFLFSLRLSKVYGDDCDLHDNLHMLTTSSDVDLNELVSKFYTQLQPQTILVISILGDKYKKLLWKLPFYVPSEHAAFLMISRFSSTRVPLFDLFQVNSEGSGRPGKLWKAPWGTDTIVDTILPDFKWIVKDFEDGTTAATLEGKISNIICHMEGWFGQHEDILLEEPVHDQKNQKISKSGGFIRIGVNNSSLPLFPSPTAKRKPVIILVLDKDIQMLPWESMKGLENRDVYRMPSVSSIFYTYHKCDESQRKAGRDASDAILDPFDAYFVINPTGSSYGEYALSEWLKNEFGLEGTCHKPVVKEISEILRARNLFIYVGHRDGIQHLPIDALAKLDRCASAILMGCYSGLLKLEGPYIPYGAPIDYLLAGSPIVVGNLWVVRQTWALEYTKKLLKTSEREMEDEEGIVACLDLARKTPNYLMYRATTICYGVPTLLRKRIP